VKAVRWLRWSARKVSAPSAGGPSPAAPSDPDPKPQTAGSSPSVRIIASSPPGIPSPVFHAAGDVSSPASSADPRDQADIALATAREFWAPPPLDGLGGDTMLAVAPVPGKILEEWRHAAYGAWIAWPHAADAIHAEEMTAAQLRAILAARDGHG
jgi:hypothetical protein